jgi:hypothetical protein
MIPDVITYVVRVAFFWPIELNEVPVVFTVCRIQVRANEAYDTLEHPWRV